LFDHTTGSFNTAVGHEALQNNTTANNNTGVGYQALNANTTGAQNTAIGRFALDANTTANENTAVGNSALGANTTGASNTAVGSGALAANTTAAHNVAVGDSALSANTTGTGNFAAGYRAGIATTTGSSNTFVGQDCGTTNTPSGFNTYVGGSDGVYGGAGGSATGEKNTFIGNGAGSRVTSGSDNTIVGRYNGNQGGLDIRTGNNNIVLSDGDGNPRMLLTSSGKCQVGASLDPNGGAQFIAQQPDNSPAIDARSTSYSYNNIVLLVGSNTNTSNNSFEHIRADIHGVAQRFSVRDSGNVKNTNNSYGALSDSRMKENIIDASSQWDDIKALRVRKYNRIGDEQKELGVIAQELEASGMAGLVEDGPYFDVENNPNEETRKSVKYSILYMKAVKALQEAMTRIETLEAKVATLEGE
jgi:hypothetical protein